MGWIKDKLSRSGKAQPSVPGSAPASGFHESELQPEPSSPQSKSAPRRELVKVVLRHTLRKHGIPPSWIDLHILSVVSKRTVSGMHVQLVVKQPDERLLKYLYALQQSLRAEIEKFEPDASQWLLSLSWQIPDDGRAHSPMPERSFWGAMADTAANPGDSLPPDSQPMPADSAPAASGSTTHPEKNPEEQQLQSDLQALFAIRDAALREEAKATGGGPDGQPDFQPTQPGW